MNQYCASLFTTWSSSFTTLGVPTHIFQGALETLPDHIHIDVQKLYDNLAVYRTLLGNETHIETLVMLSGHAIWVSDYLAKKANDIEWRQRSISIAHLAIISGNIASLNLILEQFPLLKRASHNGNTLAHFAARFGHLEILKILLNDDEHNVFFLTFRSSIGYSLLDMARHFGQQAIVEFLEKNYLQHFDAPNSQQEPKQQQSHTSSTSMRIDPPKESSDEETLAALKANNRELELELELLNETIAELTEINDMNQLSLVQ